MDKTRHRLSANVHGINFLGFLIHQEASFWTFPDVSASDLNVMLGAARLSGIVHQSTTSLSYLSLGIYGIIHCLGQTDIFFFVPRYSFHFSPKTKCRISLSI